MSHPRDFLPVQKFRAECAALLLASEKSKVVAK
jgi:hypothetical protein